MTLHQLATGVIAFANRIGRSLPLFPYPAELQIALNRVCAAALRSGSPSPQSMPDLIQWCRRPLSAWPLPLAIENAEEIGPLLDGILPTEVCETWACASSDVEAELTEQKLLLNVLTTCRQANSPDAYVAFRRLVIDRPVLTALELQQECSQLPLALLADFLRVAYEAAPAACVTTSQELVCCGVCGNLLLNNLEGGFVCEEERCREGFVEGKRAHRKISPGRRLQVQDEVLWLKRGLRRFVAAPGRAELRLERQLVGMGLQVEMWPEYDHYDLRILFANESIWAVDVKDWADPRSLGRRIARQMPNPIPSSPRWTKAYFVFPQERKSTRHDYGRAFKSSCSKLPQNVQVAFENEFLKAVRQHMEEL